jgi:fibronectin type 3 domain-containing protein
VARPGAFSLTLTSECSDSSPQIRLNWTPSSGVSTYDVYRGGTLYRSDLTGTQLVDTSVSTGSNYAYFVRAKNTGGRTDTPSQSATTPTSCLVPPGAFSLTLTSECGGTSPQIRLNWTTSSDASTYDVYRGGTLYQSDLTDNQFIDTSIVAGGGTGSGYTYFVKAKNSDGTTDTTPQSATAPTGCGIEPPGDFSLTLTPECSGSTSQIRLNWEPSSGVSTYDVYRGGTLYHSDVAGTEFVDTSVSAGGSYTYSVRANNAGGTAETTSQSETASTGCGG